MAGETPAGAFESDSTMAQLKRDCRASLDEWLRDNYDKLALNLTSVDDARKLHAESAKMKTPVGRLAMIASRRRLEAEWSRYRKSPKIRWTGKPPPRELMPEPIGYLDHRQRAQLFLDIAGVRRRAAAWPAKERHKAIARLIEIDTGRRWSEDVVKEALRNKEA